MGRTEGRHSEELESIVGKLAHASRVVKPGKTFMRRLFKLLSGVSRAHHHVRLGVAAWSDLLWWYTFMAQWNGIGMISHPRGTSVVNGLPQIHSAAGLCVQP